MVKKLDLVRVLTRPASETFMMLSVKSRKSLNFLIRLVSSVLLRWAINQFLGVLQDVGLDSGRLLCGVHHADVELGPFFGDLGPNVVAVVFIRFGQQGVGFLGVDDYLRWLDDFSGCGVHFGIHEGLLLRVK